MTEELVVCMNDLSFLAITLYIMHAASADRITHTCYYYGSVSNVFKLTILVRFILELNTELRPTPSK